MGKGNIPEIWLPPLQGMSLAIGTYERQKESKLFRIDRSESQYISHASTVIFHCTQRSSKVSCVIIHRVQNRTTNAVSCVSPSAGRHCYMDSFLSCCAVCLQGPQPPPDASYFSFVHDCSGVLTAHNLRSHLGDTASRAWIQRFLHSSWHSVSISHFIGLQNGLLFVQWFEWVKHHYQFACIMHTADSLAILYLSLSPVVQQRLFSCIYSA